MMVVIDNKLAYRIQALAKQNNRTFNQQIELMVDVFEVWPVQKVSILPGPAGGYQVPVVEVSGEVIQER